MAQKVQIILEDDLDGGEADETVSFALDGTSYEIDLNEDNATKLREALATYVGHARKVTGSRGRGRAKSAASTSGPSPKEVREWARERPWTALDHTSRRAGVRRRVKVVFALSGCIGWATRERVGCRRGWTQ